MINRLKIIWAVVMAVLMAMPCAAQSDGGKKKKKSVKTEQTTSNNTKRLQEEARRQQEEVRRLQEEVRRLQEEEAKRQQEEVRRLQEEEAKRQQEEARRLQEEEAKRQQEEARRLQEEEAKRQQEEARHLQETGSINGHEWVDLGLSVKWATCNVGASKPSEYGDYFAWGETKPKYSYDWSNCFDCLDSKGKSWGIYKIGGKTEITPTSGHDTARENWGGTWRMPTASELQELNDKCKWEWTKREGHNGYLVTGPNGKSIFLPAAGYRTGTLFYRKSGFYWSSSMFMSDYNNASYLNFNSSGHSVINNHRRNGLCIRPVTE